MPKLSLNEHQIIGFVGSDPSVRKTGKGTDVANFDVATVESWKDKATGEWQQKTEWHKVVVWKGLVGIIERFVHKGSHVYVKGPAETVTWQNKSGETVYQKQINAMVVKVVDTAAGSDVVINAPPQDDMEI